MMSSGFTVYGMSLMMSSVFTPDAVSMPTSLALAGCLSIPVMNATPEQLDEPSDASGYTRSSISVGTSSWGVSDFGEIFNLEQLNLGTPTQYWGPLYGWALIDADLDEVINVGEFIDPIDPVIGQAAIVEVSALVVGLTG